MNSDGYGQVIGVTDGDTQKVSVAGQQLLRVSLALCDTPTAEISVSVPAPNRLLDGEIEKEYAGTP